MLRKLTWIERETALLMIRRAAASPDETDYAAFTDAQRKGWAPPVPIGDEQRQLWEDNLGEVVVTSECACGTCPSIGMRPRSRADDESRDDVGGAGDRCASDREAGDRGAGDRCAGDRGASDREAGDRGERIVLDAGAPGAMLLLFIDDDSPSYLELAPIEDDGVFVEFPQAADIAF